MNTEDSAPEDIAGLFRKFGGDSHGYREFAPPEAETETPRVWPLLSGQRIAHPPAAAAPVSSPVAPVAPVPAAAPVAPVAPFAPPVHAQPRPAAAAPQPRVEPVLRTPPPAAASFAAPAADGTDAQPTPLEQLFERLAGPQPPSAAPGPLSRWRRPT